MHQIVKKSKARLSALYAALFAMAAAPMAFAGGGGTGHLSGITAIFDEYAAEAVGALVAFAVILWTLKATGLLKPRGG